MPFDPSQKDAVFLALENPKYKWRTVSGVAKEAQLPEQLVIEIIHKNQELVVRSSVPDAAGQQLFTTRNHYRTNASTITILIGAIKNRAD